MITKVVIPAAGKGTRMKELARDLPKHLIEVEGKPFLWYLMHNVTRAGLTDIILIVGHYAEKMEAFCEQYKNDFSVSLVNQFKTMGTEKYGTAIPVIAAEKYVANEQFVCIYGDNLYSANDLRVLANKNDAYTYVSLLYSEHPENYGVPILNGDTVMDFVEKPQEFITNWISTGCYKFTPEIFEKLQSVEKSVRGEYELTDAVKALTGEGKVKARKMEDYWLDFGNPNDVKTVSQFLREGKTERGRV